MWLDSSKGRDGNNRGEWQQDGLSLPQPRLVPNHYWHLITHPGKTVACGLWWSLLLRGLSLHSLGHHALCSQTLLFHTPQWGYAWGRGYIPWLKSFCLEFNLKQTPPFEKCSLSTFCITSDVSFARPCKYNAAGRAGCRVEASGLNSHTAQPETGSGREPKAQG